MKPTYLLFCSLFIAFTSLFGPHAGHGHHGRGSWQLVAVPEPSTAKNASLSAVAASGPDDAWALGTYQDQQDHYRVLIEHWNGTSWSIMPAPQGNSTSRGLSQIAAASPNEALAVGEDQTAGGQITALVMHWNGKSWNEAATPQIGKGSSLSGVSYVPHTAHAWAVGSYSLDNKTSQSLIERWDGTAWHVIPGAPLTTRSTLFLVSAYADNDVWASGVQTTTDVHGNPIAHPLVEHWNGSAWSVISASQQSYDASALVASSINAAWMVGSSADQKTGGRVTHVEHWTGKSWMPVPSPNPALFNQLNGIAARSEQDIWAVGYSSGKDQHIQNLLTEHWDGTAWTVVPAAKPSGNNSAFLSVTFIPDSNALWAVGFTSTNGTTASHALIERYQ